MSPFFLVSTTIVVFFAEFSTSRFDSIVGFDNAKGKTRPNMLWLIKQDIKMAFPGFVWEGVVELAQNARLSI